MFILELATILGAVSAANVICADYRKDGGGTVDRYYWLGHEITPMLQPTHDTRS